MEYYDVEYDDEGFAVSISGDGLDDQSDGRDPLDTWIEQQLGPLAEGESRPAFGLLRNHGTTDVDGGPHEGEEIDKPVYVAALGVRTVVDGVDVFMEGESIPASDSMQASIDALREAWVGMPEQMQGAAESIDLLQQRNPNDRENSAQFGDEFFARATAAGGHMTYWRDNDPNANTTRHEYGHLSGVNGGAPDEAAWDEAMAADLALGIREDLGGIDEDDLQIIGEREPLLTDDLGATGYGNTHLESNGNENDDWADSLTMYLSSRENGGLVQVRQDDGSVRTYTFEELYPNRAAILDAYYELGPAPEVAPPAWPEDEPTTQHAPFGDAFAAAIAASGAASGDS